MTYPCWVLALGLVLLVGPLASGQVVINELMPRNQGVLVDEDNDDPDWIELYNTGSTPVNLNGYGLSDDPDEPFKWAFGELTIEPQAHLVVFASGKNRPGFSGRWVTTIDQGHTWRYQLGSQSPPEDWNTPGFDDTDWLSGPSGFGYGDGDDATDVGETTSLYVRTRFTVDDPTEITMLTLHVDYDDAFVAYLNGEEVARAHISGNPPGPAQVADSEHEALIYQGLPPESFSIDDPTNRLQAGENVLALQVHNEVFDFLRNDELLTDLTLIPFLTLGIADGRSDGAEPAEVLRPTLPGTPHTSFRLDGDGETVLLTDPQGNPVDVWTFGVLPNTVSFGRQPDGGSERRLFSEPTPGEANLTPAFLEQLATPVFEDSGGSFTDGFEAVLQIDDPEAVVYYTTDGSVPDTSDQRYSDPIQQDSTTLIRARAFRQGYLPSDVATATFLVREQTNLPVLSLATEPDNLWDTENGIYALGPGASPDEPHFGANFWKDWEIPMHVEFFDGQAGFRADMGARIFGGWSRAAEQKSFALFARERYGTPEIDYPLFPGHEVTTFKSFILRNSGTDRAHSRIRDALMHGIVADLDLETQAYRPVVVFLNGEYWGHYNLREKINEDYLALHHRVDPNGVDILELNALVVEGSAAHYRALLEALEGGAAESPEGYAWVQEQMEVDNFIDYQIAQIFFANTDWPGSNVKFWRPQTSNGRWRWILFDTDAGFHFRGGVDASHSTLKFATRADAGFWPNPPWSTYVLRQLLENKEFELEFINRFADLLNETFRSERVTALIEELTARVRPELERHFGRWPGNMNRWNTHLDRIYTFAEERPDTMWSQVQSFFRTGPPAPITITVSDTSAGSVYVNRLRVSTPTWTGRYFSGVPVTLTASTREGFRFIGWSGTRADGSVIESTDSVLVIDPASQPEVTARFAAIVVGTEGEEDVPGVFAVEAPYPNPFRLHTQFRYRLPEPGEINLSVFDALGRRVAVIEEGLVRAGHHRVVWSPVGISPGVYLYRFTAADRLIDSGRVVLLR